MAISKGFVSSFVLSLLLLHLLEARLQSVSHDQMISSNDAKSSLMQTMDCGGACDARCQLSSRPRLCKRACGTCCSRCNCVPPGTSGNLESCPCYANQTTHGGRPKCP